MFKILAIIIAFAACISRTANANLNHVVTMNEAKTVISPPHSAVNFTERNIRNFWTKVRKTKDCWIWTGAPDRDGYGIFRAGGRMIRAHVFSHLLHGGTFADGPLILHGPCNRPACVNPEHLYPGTHKQNCGADKIRDGTLPTGDEHHARKHPERLARGERNGSAKLTEAAVIIIRSEYATGQIGTRTLAKKLSIPRSTIQQIVSRKNWRHVT